MPTLNICGVPVSFPFEPYESQLVYMEKVVRALESKQNAMLESPTGTGKTLCLLCATLGWRVHRKKQLKSQSSKKKLQYEDAATEDNEEANEETNKLPKIIYASRTHSQLKQVVKELKQTAYSPKIAILGSREHLCVHPEVSKMRGTQQNHTCRLAVRAQKCTYKLGYDQYVKSKKNIANLPIMDIEELVTTMERRETCPFYLSRDMLTSADIVFMPYNYLVEPFVRNSLGVTLENAVLVFDEAHNVESVATEAASYSLSSVDIQGCIREVDECHNLIVSGRVHPGEDTYLSSQSATTLKNLLVEILAGLNTFPLNDKGGCTKPGSFIFDFFKQFNISFDTAPMVTTITEQVIEAMSDYAQSNPRNSKLDHLLTFLRTIFRDKENHQAMAKQYRVHIQEENAPRTRQTSNRPVNSTMRMFHYWCFHPGVAMNELVENNVHNIILTSGTLSPLDTTIKELGIPFPITLENSHVIDPSQVWVGVVGVGVTGKKLNASYESRNSPDYVLELGNTLVNITRVVPNGLLVFFPSYSILDMCISQWQAQGSNIWERLQGLKSIFVEPKNRVEFADVVQSYHACIAANPNGAIFFAVCRGKVSEGIDFSNENGRAVVITGLPFPPTKDPKIVLKKTFLDNLVTPPGEMKLSGNQWYVQQASRAVNQAVGRVIRHRHDFGAIILLDERFAFHQQKGSLSKWLQPFVQIIPSYGAAHGALTRFFKHNKEQATAAAQSAKSATKPTKSIDTKGFVPPKKITNLPAPPVEKPADVIASQVAIGDGQTFVPPTELSGPAKKSSTDAPVSLELLVHQARTLLSSQDMTAFVTYMRDPKNHLDEIEAILAPHPTLQQRIAPLLPPRNVAQAMYQLQRLKKRKHPGAALATTTAVANPQCSICFDIVQTTSAPPCGHLCCVRCWKKLELPDHTIQCPVCKGSFHVGQFTPIVAKRVE
ncbi:unnamed protein product [Aphanomyces euteiches]|uniref:Regulator of telomere elongation helicase 1 homolog n=1 Tax=Aphanomyces euteiches TaxID=100861 RepID=A0A6G0XJA7_9STRA|nr:hypothetical protein Ae201684_004426 [Aphanomyces euteiches]KAH9093830.1 hypothetical protein Ae201684P_016452 [Aphanomyces euteiches]KAH9147435.1 hypothetical protein AeRB84_008956 [Aphanomyces euteiches]KAH9151225.1 hypothetical protein AeRB84_006122 [Aphanomyces euteiches]